ncbi:MAG: DivIVA domain-containing protein [Longimicrobiales bacterium]
MIDLTPLEVRKKKGDFKRAMRGYDPGMVDDFLEIVADRLEELVRANLGHEDRVRQLEQQLRDYKERERALTDALVSAQELREEMREQALRDADAARREAQEEAERIRTNVTQEIEREEQMLRRLRARQAQLAQSYRALLEREMEELEVMAGGVSYRAGLDEEEDASEPAAPRDAVRQQEAPRTERAPRDPARSRPERQAAVREVPPAYGAASSAGVAAAAGDDRVPAPHGDRAPAAGPVDAADDEEEVDDEALERSLEALQVVFARDEAEVRRDWPLPDAPRTAGGSAQESIAPEQNAQDRATQDRTVPVASEPDLAAAESSHAGFAAPAPSRFEEAPVEDPRIEARSDPVPEQHGDPVAVPVAFEEDAFYGDELLLEDAIEEGDADYADDMDDEEPQPAAVADPWLPKLIEDAP